jgi:hypothetical protein
LSSLIFGSPVFLVLQHEGESVAHEIRRNLALALEPEGRVDLVAEQLESVAHVAERRIVCLGVVTGLARGPGPVRAAPIAAQDFSCVGDVEVELESALTLWHLHDAASDADCASFARAGGLAFHPALDFLRGQQRESVDDLLDHLPDLQLGQAGDQVVVLAVGALLEKMHQMADAVILGVLGESHIDFLSDGTHGSFVDIPMKVNVSLHGKLSRFLFPAKVFQGKQSASGFSRRARLGLFW